MKIAVIPGDGIGPDIVKQAYKVLDRVSEAFNMKFEYQEVDMEERHRQIRRASS